jgi:hypothetical protein
MCKEEKNFQNSSKFPYKSMDEGSLRQGKETSVELYLSSVQQG